jgi:hypothetical protein
VNPNSPVKAVSYNQLLRKAGEAVERFGHAHVAADARAFPSACRAHSSSALSSLLYMLSAEERLDLYHKWQLDLDHAREKARAVAGKPPSNNPKIAAVRAAPRYYKKCPINLSPPSAPRPMKNRIFRFTDIAGQLQTAGYRSRVRLDDGTVAVVASFEKDDNGLTRMVLVCEDGTTLILTPHTGFPFTDLLDIYVDRVEPKPRHASPQTWTAPLNYGN